MARPAGLTGASGSLALVRHGESTWIAEGRYQGQADPPLSPLGERQAAAVAARLRDRALPPALPLPAVPPLGVWHSPLGRAARTAGAIAGAIGASTPVHERDQLKELDQGAWEGLHRTEIEARYGRRLAAWRRDPTRYHATGGESLAAGARRVSLIAGEVNAALSAAGAAPPAPTTGHAVRSPVLHAGSSPDGWPWAVVVAHDGVLRLLTLYLLGLPRTAYWSLPFALCGITIVELVDGRGRLRAHNLTEHLAGAAASTAKPRPEGAL